MLVAKPLCLEPFANLLNGRLAGKTDVNESAATEVNAVHRVWILRIAVNYGNPANGQKYQGKGDEVLRLPHPVNIDAVEEFHA